MNDSDEAEVYLVLKIEPSSHGVDDRFWLLEDFLLHKVAVIALHDFLQFHFQNGNLSSMWIVHVPPQPVDAQGAILNSSNIVVLKINHSIGVFNNCRGIRGKEILHFVVF